MTGKKMKPLIWRYGWLLLLGPATLLGLVTSRVIAQEPPPTDNQLQVMVQQGTTFSYQGQLKREGKAVDDSCTFQFSLWDAAGGGLQKGSSQTLNPVEVSNGLFSVLLDFGNQFSGDAHWLETAVQCSGDGGLTTLTPRQELTAVPYALGLRPGASIIGALSNGGAALLGQNNDPTAYSKGLWGRADAGGAFGVYGSSAAGQAVRGDSTSGVGVVGYSSSGDAVRGLTLSGKSGVYGENRNLTAYSTGVWGRADAQAAFGVFGSSANGTGIRGDSTNSVGVVGYSANGDAIRGLTLSGKSAVYGENRSATAYSTGVWGRSDAGGTFGVYGSSASGQAIRGDSTTGIAVAGAVSTANGWAGYFSGGKGVSTNVLQIRGGSDLAEQFEVSAGPAVRVGSLLVIDETHPGQLTLSTTPYDRKVAGVVSGAGGVQPGLILYQEGLLEGDTQVALAGRVYGWAEADSAAIQPGDLLTSSAVPGHVMKVSDFERAQGAIIGKAMSALPAGRGLVLILVNLQ